MQWSRVKKLSSVCSRLHAVTISKESDRRLGWRGCRGPVLEDLEPHAKGFRLRGSVDGYPSGKFCERLAQGGKQLVFGFQKVPSRDQPHSYPQAIASARGHWAEQDPHINSSRALKFYITVIPLSQMRPLRLREGLCLAQGHSGQGSTGI